MAEWWTVAFDDLVLKEHRRRTHSTVDEQARQMGLDRADLYRARKNQLPEGSDKKRRYDTFIARLLLEYMGMTIEPRVPGLDHEDYKVIMFLLRRLNPLLESSDKKGKLDHCTLQKLLQQLQLLFGYSPIEPSIPGLQEDWDDALFVFFR